MMKYADMATIGNKPATVKKPVKKATKKVKKGKC